MLFLDTLTFSKVCNYRPYPKDGVAKVFPLFFYPVHRGIHIDHPLRTDPIIEGDPYSNPPYSGANEL